LNLKKTTIENLARGYLDLKAFTYNVLKNEFPERDKKELRNIAQA
jgi:hypothetical protein